MINNITIIVILNCPYSISLRFIVIINPTPKPFANIINKPQFSFSFPPPLIPPLN